MHSKMFKYVVVLLSIPALSSAQFASAPQRARNDNTVAQSSSKNQDNTFGRTSNLRSGDSKQRNLQLSMSMPSVSGEPGESLEDTVEPAPASPEEEFIEILLEQEPPIGCMPDDVDVCPEDSSCHCWLNCRFCPAAFAPCGTCKVDT
mmetsp:Transcript_6001/g.13624  ORF Transcript_6001/g.13624 Transcript_6001/m.13624 type:complete len:147 (+) Transcript_6001:110-550(+)